jgi:hypothetical protein
VNKQLQLAQKQLELAAKKEIDNPMTDYDQLRELIDMIEKLDSFRRSVWSKQTFGQSERVANSLLNIHDAFSSDDIPF